MRNFLYLLVFGTLFTSCKSGLPFFKKSYEKSSITGRNYNDKSQGNFIKSPQSEQQTGPGLVFVQGGTFTMGATDEDIMGDYNNIPRRVTVSSFYIDKTEVANIHYREYMHWLQSAFGDEPNYQDVIEGAKPDTLVWRSELASNEPLVDYYLRHPSYNNYPVVGVTWRQASDFCVWRGARVNEIILVQKGVLDKKALGLDPSSPKSSPEQVFTTKSYLFGLHDAKSNQPEKISKKNPFYDKENDDLRLVTLEDGILQPDYRLPTEAEWEYAALAYIQQNPNAKKKEGKRGEELLMNRQVYSWATNVNGLRDSRSGTWQGKYMANFKRGAGDYMGVAGGLNDNSSIPGPVNSFFPNGFGIYNMSGNVNEWVADVYRPSSPKDVDDFNPYRGNVFMKPFLNQGKFELDKMGRIKMEQVSDKDAAKRVNYQKGDVINYLDGDSLSGALYGSGISTLISDKSRVYKGGGWDDVAYWLSPGTRRYLDEDQSSSSIGFRCAMDRFGSQEGNGFKNGNHFSNRRQNTRKK